MHLELLAFTSTLNQPSTFSTGVVIVEAKEEIPMILRVFLSYLLANRLFYALSQCKLNNLPQGNISSLQFINSVVVDICQHDI